jgi:hypothetical protein
MQPTGQPSLDEPERTRRQIHLAPVFPGIAGDGLGYGNSDEIRQLLDGVGVQLAEEPQSHWNENPDLREATRAVADHLYFRLGLQPPNDGEADSCSWRRTAVVPPFPPVECSTPSGS